MKLIDQNQQIKIIELYKQGYNYTQIAQRVGMTDSGVGKRLRPLFENGTLEKREKPKPKTEELEENPEKGAVRCNIAMSKKCVYGYESKERCRSFGTCSYILRTGHPRGCSPRNCTKFEEITKENPRKKDIM